MKRIEPFAYYSEHASAIPGLGGDRKGPDPNYCFHTAYADYEPGLVIFRIRLKHAHAAQGEMTIRIHGYRPNYPHLGIKLLASHRENLSSLEGVDHDIVIRFSAIPGVSYAGYGFFSAPTDIRAEDIEFIVEELGGDTVENYLEGSAPPTMLSLNEITSVHGLVSDKPAQLHFPASQACTRAQLREIELHDLWPVLGESCAETERWRLAHMLQSLDVFGLLQPGANGLLIGDIPEAVLGILTERQCIMRKVAIEGPASATVHGQREFYDFLICSSVSAFVSEAGGVPASVDLLIQKLGRGGMAVISFDYLSEGGDRKLDSGTVTRVDLERLALRLIGHACDVAQLHFPSGVGEDVAPDLLAPFNFVVRR